MAPTASEQSERLQPPSLPLDRIGLTVGVTGQRDFPPELDPKLRTEFATILRALSQTYPHTPLVVLSALATGTEILAVEVAHSLGIPVVACLPMAPAAYESTLGAPAERERFLATLGMCARVDVASSAPDRASRLLDAGLYIAHYSQIVVAFWDGGTSDGDPTAHVAGLRLPGIFGSGAVPANLAELPELGPVYQIAMSRSGDPPAEGPGPVVKHFPQRFADDDEFEKDFAMSLDRLDRCNADLARVASPPASTTTIDALRDHTGDVANGLQRTTFAFLYVLYAVAIIATAAQYTSIEWLKYAMFPIAFVAYRLAKRFDYENRYQDYRALSEGLRVQSGWLSAGLRDDQADKCYLGMQEKELQWIRMALRYAYFAFRDSVPGGSIDSPGARDWIDGQCQYFSRAPRREERKLRRLKLGQRAIFLGAIAISAILFTYLYLPTAPQFAAEQLGAFANGTHVSPDVATWLRSSSRYWANVQADWNARPPGSGWLEDVRQWDVGHRARHTWLVRLSTAVLALYAAIALLISNYSDKRAFSQNARRYDRMFVVFDRARRSLDAMPDRDAAAGRELVRELGRAALIENADWLLARRDRPLAYVKATPGQ